MSDKKLMLETTLRDAFRLAFLEYPKDRIKIKGGLSPIDVEAAIMDGFTDCVDGGLWISKGEWESGEEFWTIEAAEVVEDWVVGDRWVAALRLASILRQRSLNPDYDYYFDGLRKGSEKQQQQQQESD